MSHFWFKPKRYGLGAVPANWKGWAFTGAYFAAILVLALLTRSSLTDHGAQSFAFIVSVVALTIVFIGVCWRKTEGGWGWRWGGD